MAPPTLVALILGAGPNIGSSVASKFASAGYKIAIASRSGGQTGGNNGYLSLKADFSKPDSIPALFDAVKSEFNTAPSVVVYNAAGLTPPPDNDSVLSIPVDNFVADLNLNTVSPYVAAQHAVKGWETLPSDVKKSFIYTGNILNTLILPVPMMLTLGVGKSASAHWIGLADATYAAKGFRFFYVDERIADGKQKGIAIDGPAHADFFAQLAEHQEGVPWHATFVKDKGYVKFE
ncbi:NAD(P)-binding protein [Cucurbitaria berberidis CBS 394.84]|uniref:NAD(P)-binding protein n=1 Tax=Cucurbitaria berberidis CBS 394.84 TaxID=1168544 RepID=A0A9P4G9L4_9PLEO|nr:NAD(P)-binding protein [Cucurbitaria berberidis CBS 394.84]KAF1841391.1 NAD(P)-binding protein [Cucurbitaria berberidis CBS 394.84]